jgi:hypothetical protein
MLSLYSLGDGVERFWVAATDISELIERAAQPFERRRCHERAEGRELHALAGRSEHPAPQ